MIYGIIILVFKIWIEGDISMKRKLAVMLTAAASAFSTAAFSSMTAFADDADAASTEPTASNPVFTLIIPLAIMFVLLYFMAIRPQKKKEQEMKDMQNSLQVGDEIVTSGGIVGMIVRVGDDNVVIETGGERNKLRIKNWAIAENVTAVERAKAAAPKKSANPLASAGLSDDGEKKKSKKSKKEERSSEE